MIPKVVDDEGRLYTTTDVVDASSVYLGGVAFTPAKGINISALPPEVFANSLGLLQDGALCCAAGGAIAGYAGGFPFTVDGAIVTQIGNTPAATDPFVGGIRVGPAGGVYLVNAAPPAPENTVAPVITGIPSSSNTLTCDPGTWLNTDSIAFRWLRNNVPIMGATGSTLTLSGANSAIGDAMSCAVTGSNDYTAETVQSNELIRI